MATSISGRQPDRRCTTISTQRQTSAEAPFGRIVTINEFSPGSVGNSPYNDFNTSSTWQCGKTWWIGLANRSVFGTHPARPRNLRDRQLTVSRGNCVIAGT